MYRIYWISLSASEKYLYTHADFYWLFDNYVTSDQEALGTRSPVFIVKDTEVQVDGGNEVKTRSNMIFYSHFQQRLKIKAFLSLYEIW